MRCNRARNGEDECGAGDVSDFAGAGGDVLEGAPALVEQGERAFAEAAQGPLDGVAGAGVDVQFPAVGGLFGWHVDADAHERAVRLNTRVHQLEKRLSEALGEQTWRESGLGTPTDIDALNQKITHLEQQAIDLRLRLEERDGDLTAARTANRELMAQLNHTSTRR